MKDCISRGKKELKKRKERGERERETEKGRDKVGTKPLKSSNDWL